MNISRISPTRVALIVLAAVGFSGLAATVVVAQPDPFFLAGVAHRMAASDTERIAARVNGHILSVEDIEVREALVELNNSVSATKVMDAHAAFRAGVRDLVLFDAAVKRGLNPTEADVDGYIESIRSDFAANPAAHEQLLSYLRGFGLSEDAFFARAPSRARYAEALAIARLRQQVPVTAWSSFADQLVASATVEILDPSFE